MAQLSCVYCGRKLQIKGHCTYGRGRCPSCRHIIFIPRQGRVEEVVNQKNVKDRTDWSKFSDEQVAEMLRLQMRASEMPDEQEIRRQKWKTRLRAFIPSYDEVTLFTLSFSFIAIYLMSGRLREDFYYLVGKTGDWEIIAAVLAAAAGMLLSLIGVFSKRKKYDFEKYPILFFAVAVTAGTGIYAGYMVLEESKGWLIIFPAWNIVNGAILILLFRFGILDTECIVENGFDFLQILASAAIAGLILALCNYVFKMHWVISYSICVCYTISINDAIHSFLGINRD